MAKNGTRMKSETEKNCGKGRKRNQKPEGEVENETRILINDSFFYEFSIF